jgi:hypothetical protein
MGRLPPRLLTLSVFFCRREEVAEPRLNARKLAIKEESKAVPALIDEARKGLNSITNARIAELSFFARPPTAIQNVCAAVMTLLRQEPDWAGCKRVLKSKTFIGDLLGFDVVTAVSPAVRGKVGKMIRENPSSFEANEIARVSQAAGALAQWVSAQIKCADLLERVRPQTMALGALTSAMRGVDAAHRKMPSARVTKACAGFQAAGGAAVSASASAGAAAGKA